MMKQATATLPSARDEEATYADSTGEGNERAIRPRLYNLIEVAVAVRVWHKEDEHEGGTGEQ